MQTIGCRLAAQHKNVDWPTGQVNRQGEDAGYEPEESQERSQDLCRSLVLDRWRPGSTVSGLKRDRGSLQTEQAVELQQLE